MLFVEFSLYLASRFIGKFGGFGVCAIGVKEGVERSERVSGSDKYVSDETSIGSFIKIWFALGESLCHPKSEMFCSGWGVERVFSNLFRCRG